MTSDLNDLVARIEARYPGDPRWRRVLDPDSPDHQPGYERTARILLGDVAAPARPGPDAVNPPSLRTMAATAARAAAGFVASGFKRATPEEQERRIAICRKCDLFDAAKGRCRKCGCFAKWKAWIAGQSCPEGHW